MPSLEKAKIYEITAGDSPRAVDEGIEVQFNPESLSISLSNRVEGGRNSGRQVRQFVGSSSNTFSLDLEFDTADEGSTEEPISVLERTTMLDKFIQPKKVRGQRQETPAKLRFHWGHMIIDGVVENIDIELDHFAHNGFPLHAKVTIKLKEQKIEFQFAERGGSEDAGTGAGSPSEQVAQALDDELPSEAASRLGLDPSDWRGLGFDLGLGLSLEAGLELSFDAEFSASFGIDIKAGINADIDLSLEASLGLEAGVSISAPHLNRSNNDKASLSTGLALAKSGGIEAATNIVKSNKAQTASTASVNAFSSQVSTMRSTNRVSAVSSSSVPTSSGLSASISTQSTSLTTTNSNAGSIRVDKRATTYGFAVPLKRQRVPILSQQDSLRAYQSVDQLSASFGGASKAANKVQSRRRPKHRCGCGCKH